MVDFPRGGGSSLTPAERREITDMVERENNNHNHGDHPMEQDDQNLFTESKKKDNHQNKKKRSAAAATHEKGRKKTKSEAVKVDDEDEVDGNGVMTMDIGKKGPEILRYKVHIVEVMIVLVVVDYHFRISLEYGRWNKVPCKYR